MEVEFKPSTEPGCAGFFPRSVAFISERGPGAIDEYDGKVVECQFTPETGCWEVTRVRVDKTHPNSAVTAGSIAGCIANPVTESDMREVGRLQTEEAVEREQQGRHSALPGRRSSREALGATFSALPGRRPSSEARGLLPREKAASTRRR